MINSVVIMGRLTHEPELRTTPSGISVIKFNVACDRNKTKSGEEKKTDFIDCTAWRQTAEFIARYFHKGSMIAIEGSIQTDSFTDKDGNKRKSVQVVADQVSFCGSKAESGSQESPKPTSNTNNSQPAQANAVRDNDDFEEIIDDDDDLPF